MGLPRDHFAAEEARTLVDGSGRHIRYLRLSVTDRCDLRCGYCMPEEQTFLPRRDLLTIEELARLCSVFIGMGTRKLRITGGEPLVRRGVVDLLAGLSAHLGRGLDELTLTTNGTRLAPHARDLAACGVRRINVSLDTLDPERFRLITGRDRLADVLRGIDAALGAGLEVKLNVVAQKGVNEQDFVPIVRWAHERGMDCSFIEVMPLGVVGEDRRDRFMPLLAVRAMLAAHWTMIPSAYDSGGPARYQTVVETGRRIGFISPLSHHFCDSCNRVRIDCTGRLFGCLGREESFDLRRVLRASEGDRGIEDAILRAIAMKPRGHDFDAQLFAGEALDRHMNATGG